MLPPLSIHNPNLFLTSTNRILAKFENFQKNMIGNKLFIMSSCRNLYDQNIFIFESQSNEYVLLTLKTLNIEIA